MVDGSGKSVLFFHAAHFHAEMLSVTHYQHAFGLEDLLDVVTNFSAKTFLDLEFVCANINHASQFA